MIYGSVTVPIDYIKKEKAEAVVSHSLPTPVGYGLPALSAASLNNWFLSPYAFPTEQRHLLFVLRHPINQDTAVRIVQTTAVIDHRAGVSQPLVNTREVRAVPGIAVDGVEDMFGCTIVQGHRILAGHELIGPEFIHFRSCCPDHHALGHWRVAGADHSFSPLDLNHAELAAFINEAGFLLFESFVPPVDEFGWLHFF